MTRSERSRRDRQDGPAEATAEEVLEQLNWIRDHFATARVRAVGIFDQFLASLRPLELSIDRVLDLDLPQGQRIELVRAVGNIMKTAVYCLAREWDAPGDPGDPFGQALEVIEGVRRCLEERRLETRATLLAHQVTADDDDMDRWDAFERVATHPDLLAALVREAGWEPPDETIRAWLLRHGPKA